jgi:hypothetical protein
MNHGERLAALGEITRALVSAMPRGDDTSGRVLALLAPRPLTATLAGAQAAG